jgi:hypothetical protein
MYTALLSIIYSHWEMWRTLSDSCVIISEFLQGVGHHSIVMTIKMEMSFILDGYMKLLYSLPFSLHQAIITLHIHTLKPPLNSINHLLAWSRTTIHGLTIHIQWDCTSQVDTLPCQLLRPCNSGQTLGACGVLKWMRLSSSDLESTVPLLNYLCCPRFMEKWK